jgi:predicted nucleotide-binding protein
MRQGVEAELIKLINELTDTSEKLQRADETFFQLKERTTHLINLVFRDPQYLVNALNAINYDVDLTPRVRRKLVAFLGDLKHRLRFPDRLKPSVKFLSPADLAADPALSSRMTPPSPQRVFVVHGHDVVARKMVARFLKRLGLQPVVLHQQPNIGMTVIEKLEHYSDVSFAVVLLTPDDEGRSAGATEPPKGRARQNVVLELGYFLGKLGRRRVCALYRGSLELPSDYGGVLYVRFDDGGGWRSQLAKELKAAQFSIDTNLVP